MNITQYFPGTTNLIGMKRTTKEINKKTLPTKPHLFHVICFDSLSDQKFIVTVKNCCIPLNLSRKMQSGYKIEATFIQILNPVFTQNLFLSHPLQFEFLINT